MTVVRVLVLLLAMGCFGSFGWAMKRLFTKPDGESTSMRALTACATVCAVAHLTSLLWFNNSSLITSAAGALLYSLAVVLFWWSVRSTRTAPLSFALSCDTPTSLSCTGPYGLVRHPFYTSYLLAWLAGTVATEQPWLLVTVVLMGTFYYRAAGLEETKFDSSSLRKEYTAYAEATGRFSPRIWRSGTCRQRMPERDEG